MKNLKIRLDKKQKQQLQLLAQLVNKQKREYLQYIEFCYSTDSLKNSVKISGTNGIFLIDLNFVVEESNLEAGEIFQIHSNYFLQIQDGLIEIELNDQITLYKDSGRFKMEKMDHYVDLERIRFKEYPKDSVKFSLKALTKIMKVTGSDIVEIHFEPEERKYFLKSQNFEAILLSLM